jgi:hypothetical protein
MVFLFSFSQTFFLKSTGQNFIKIYFNIRIYGALFSILNVQDFIWLK